MSLACRHPWARCAGALRVLPRRLSASLPVRRERLRILLRPRSPGAAALPTPAGASAPACLQERGDVPRPRSWWRVPAVLLLACDGAARTDDSNLHNLNFK